MKRTAKSFTFAVTLGGLLLGASAFGAAPEAEAQTYRRYNSRRTVVTRVPARSTLGNGDWDRDGIRNSRDRDDDNDGVRDNRDRSQYSGSGTLYRNGTRYRNGTVMRNGRIVNSRTAGWGNGVGLGGVRRNDLDRDGIPDSRDKDRDGDGVRNVHDRRPDNRRSR